jgi:hypothetical protein
VGLERWHREQRLVERGDWGRCPGCRRLLPINVRRCSSRRCPEFAPIWARDTRRRLFENLKMLKLVVMFSDSAR